MEKPLVLTVRDADRMIGAARRAGVKLGVISQRRLYEPVQRVRQAVVDGKLGRPGMGTRSLLGWRGPDYDAVDD